MRVVCGAFANEKRGNCRKLARGLDGFLTECRSPATDYRFTIVRSGLVDTMRNLPTLRHHERAVPATFKAAIRVCLAKTSGTAHAFDDAEMRRVDTVRQRVSYADLQRMPEDGNRYELYDGELYVVPSRRINLREHVRFPPDIAMEVLSPSTARNDRGRKRDLMATTVGPARR